MRILILGGGGMIGHALWQHLPTQFPDTYTSIRRECSEYRDSTFFESDRVIESVDAGNFDLLKGVLTNLRPQMIINCVGLTKRREQLFSAEAFERLNAILPYELAEWGAAHGARLISFSTDCVFDGKLGKYTEESPTSASDVYGKTKAHGEIDGMDNVLTLRSSFIGRELNYRSELLEWFLAQTGIVKGFRNAIYSGFTTIELCRIVEKILLDQPGTSGLYNISSEPINKYDLLVLIKKKMNLAVEVIPDETFCCDRSLDSSKFRREFNYSPPSWQVMIEELART